MTVACRFLFYLLVSLLLPLAPRAMAAPWTIQEAVRYALEHSPDAQAAQARIEAAQADIRGANAAFLPQLGLQAEYSRTNNPMYSFGNILNQGQFDNSIDFNDPGDTDVLQMQATLRYRLYNGGRDQAGTEAAQAMEAAANHGLQAVHTSLGYEVVRACHTILQAEETQRANTSALQAISTSIEVAQARYEEGDLLRTDLLNLEVQQSRARENLIQANHALELARRAFLNLLGLREGSVAIVQPDNKALTAPADLSAGLRPELQGLKARIRAAEATIQQAKGERLPTVDAFASYQVEQGLELDDGSGNSYLAGVRMDYALFDGQRTAAAIQRAQARLAESTQLLRKAELAYALEMEQARLNLAQAEERLQVTTKMLELARESADLSRARFKEGVILSSDLIDAENRLNDAEVRHALAKAARSIALADLRRTGGLPQFDPIDH